MILARIRLLSRKARKRTTSPRRTSKETGWRGSGRRSKRQLIRSTRTTFQQGIRIFDSRYIIDTEYDFV